MDKKNGFCGNKHNPAFVLNDVTPNEVASAMIESGRQKEPFYILNLDETYQRIRYLQKVMPRVQIYYAMKANSADMIIKLAVTMGLGYDCASPGEINMLRKLNVHPQSIIYAMPVKTPEQMLYARASGVVHTTFDSSYELKKITQYWPEARLLLRIRADGDSNYVLGNKFGCDFETEAIELLDEAASLGLQVIGISFHVGSACISSRGYEEGIRNARLLFDHEVSMGREMKILDIGGGFFSDVNDRIDQVSIGINKCLQEQFPEPNIQIVAEPGRYLCDSACVLYCNISDVRRTKENGNFVNVLYINDGIYGGLRYPEPWQPVKKYKRSTDKINTKLEEAILWGPTCDCRDRILPNTRIRLPRCTPSDWLIFENQGAYTFNYSTNFSQLEPPGIRPVLSMALWNKIKDSEVYTSRDFVINPDISTPLPLKLPRIFSVDESAQLCSGSVLNI